MLWVARVRSIDAHALLIIVAKIKAGRVGCDNTQRRRCDGAAILG